jgi:hypothetical protein
MHVIHVGSTQPSAIEVEYLHKCFTYVAYVQQVTATQTWKDKVPFDQSKVETCKPLQQRTATRHVKALLFYGKNGSVPLQNHPWVASLLGQS